MSLRCVKIDFGSKEMLYAIDHGTFVLSTIEVEERVSR